MASFGIFKTPRGILRVLEILCAIISFGAMADLSGFKQVSEYEFLVAAGAIAFVYAFIMTVIYICQDKVDNACLWTPVVELAGDGILTILLFAAAVSSAVACNKERTAPNGTNYEYCDVGETNKQKAAIAFTFLDFFMFLASTWFSYKLNVEEEKKPAEAAPRT